MTRDSYKNIKVKDPQTLNLYIYCDDNPVSNTDPSGESPPDYATWKAFEDQLGQILNTTKNNVQGNGGRIIDYITDEGAGWEAKSGQYVCNSQQLDAFIEQFKDQFNLVVGPATRVSQPLIDRIQSNLGNIWMMVNGNLQEFAASPAGQDIEQGIQDLSNIPPP